MDFAKLVSLFQTNSLYFPRLDQLGDPFEGSLSKAEYDRWVETAAEGELNGHLPADWRGRYLEVLLGNARRARLANYVSCWYAGEHESEAMWRLYAASSYAVAVQSTYRRLVEAIPAALCSRCYAGQVRYADHHTEMIPDGNIFHAIMHKRRAFEHEREVRLVIWEGDPGPGSEADLARNPLGLSVQVELRNLIERVYVSPSAPTWFAETVLGVVRTYGVGCTVVQSDLLRKPYF